MGAQRMDAMNEWVKTICAHSHYHLETGRKEIL